MNGTVGGVARSFEITNCDGSIPWAIMPCSTSGSLRMNSAENPPAVDCSVIDTAGPGPGVPRVRKRPRWFCPVGRLTVPAGSSNLGERIRQGRILRCRGGMYGRIHRQPDALRPLQEFQIPGEVTHR